MIAPLFFCREYFLYKDFEMKVWHFYKFRMRQLLNFMFIVGHQSWNIIRVLFLHLVVAKFINFFLFSLMIPARMLDLIVVLVLYFHSFKILFFFILAQVLDPEVLTCQVFLKNFRRMMMEPHTSYSR